MTPNLTPVLTSRPVLNQPSDISLMRQLAERSTYITCAAMLRVEISLCKDLTTKETLLKMAERFEGYGKPEEGSKNA